LNRSFVPDAVQALEARGKIGRQRRHDAEL
jgi:hypothetical protein